LKNIHQFLNLTSRKSLPSKYRLYPQLQYFFSFYTKYLQGDIKVKHTGIGFFTLPLLDYPSSTFHLLLRALSCGCYPEKVPGEGVEGKPIFWYFASGGTIGQALLKRIGISGMLLITMAMGPDITLLIN